MSFSAEVLKKLADEYQSLDHRCDKLFMNYVARECKNARAREYSRHGFPRRLTIMVQCIKNVFELLPPESTDVPSRAIRMNAMINIQAFVFNVFGAIDNLAWIWIQDRELKKGDGTDIPDGWVGLGPKNKLIRESFSQEFQEYLASMNDWFGYLADFRHSLAHRIPLYIPPAVVTQSNYDAYQEIEDRKVEALKRHDFAENDRLTIEQAKLTTFRPWIQHSLREGVKPIVFHAQMIADFMTIEELGWKMAHELDSP